MNKYYDEINKVLTEYENYKPYHSRDIHWACNRIGWCWQWKKITKKQMIELANRATEILVKNKRI